MIRKHQLINIFTLTSPLGVAAFQFLPAQNSLIATPTSLRAAPSSSVVSRGKRVSNLKDWGREKAGIQVASTVNIEESKLTGGLGLVTTRNVDAKNSVVVSVPASVALSIELPRGGPDDTSIIKDLVEDRKAYCSLPWYAQFALYLNKLDKISSKKDNDVELQPWLDSLPRQFTTPIHWEGKEREEWLQYSHMTESVERQQHAWKNMYNKLQSCCSSRTENMTWDDFLWGCEIARSRAFSGGYAGTPFNPFVYVFTLVLVTVYVALNLGSLEQAANGAALVFCASVLQDFVLPKLLKNNKKYVICPVIDMANHNSLRTTANVAFEYFANAYSLSTTSFLPSNAEVFISYGSRSNDQLLQYFGFVEPNNPHDSYVMPPLRDWDIAALERACGGNPFPPGRLQKLDRAGLLGTSLADVGKADSLTGDDIASEERETSAGNPRGGVVLSRAFEQYCDPAVIQALRALVSDDREWQEAGESIGNFAAEVSPNNERKARLAARTAIEMELASKPTTIDEDRELLNRFTSLKAKLQNPEEQMAVLFRIEKKKLLKEAIDKLQ